MDVESKSEIRRGAPFVRALSSGEGQNEASTVTKVSPATQNFDHKEISMSFAYQVQLLLLHGTRQI